MTREQLKKELRALDWESIDYDGQGDIKVEAPARRLNYWYSISKHEGAYVLTAENHEGTITTTIASNVKSIEEAKQVAWDDYAGQILQLFQVLQQFK